LRLRSARKAKRAKIIKKKIGGRDFVVVPLNAWARLLLGLDDPARANGGLGIMLRGLEALGIKAKLPERIAVKSFLATPSKTIPIKTITLR
jgi:hypothetical protein